MQLYGQSDSLIANMILGLDSVSGNAKCDKLYNVAAVYSGINPDSSAYYSRQSLDCARSSGNDTTEAQSLFQLARSFDVQGVFDSSKYYFLHSLEIFRQLKDSSEISSTLSALGNTMYYQGDYVSAMTYQQESLNLARLHGNMGQVAITLNNLAILCTEQRFYDQALEHYQESLEIQLPLENPNAVGAIYLNIGNIHLERNDQDRALNYFLKADTIFNDTGNKYALSLNWSNMAEVYGNLNNHAKGVELYEKAIKIQNEINDEYGIAYSEANLAYSYHMMGQTPKAIKTLEHSKKLAENSGALTILKKVYQTGVRINKDVKRWDKAFAYQELLSSVEDSLLNAQTQETLGRLEALYEDEKRENELIKAREEASLSELEATQRKNQLFVSYGIGSGLMVVLVFTVIIISTKIKTNRQLEATNVEISHKNLVITARNNEVNQSLKYAQRLQMAMFANFDKLETSYSAKELINRPMKIVSGDFFFVQREGSNTLAAVGDCTGHGVPGALLTMVAHTSLDRAVKEVGFTDPDRILIRTNELMSTAFNPHLRTESIPKDKSVRDGMDITLTLYNSATKELKFCAANHRVFVLSNGELIETKGDPVSLGDPNSIPKFIIHSREMMKGDVVVLFSDGIVDQFGGPNDKKFGIARLRELVSKDHETLNDLRMTVENAVNDWRGDQARTDDNMIMMLEV